MLRHFSRQAAVGAHDMPCAGLHFTTRLTWPVQVPLLRTARIAAALPCIAPAKTCPVKPTHPERMIDLYVVQNLLHGSGRLMPDTRPEYMAATSKHKAFTRLSTHGDHQKHWIVNTDAFQVSSHGSRPGWV